jgi:hypothetical protein
MPGRKARSTAKKLDDSFKDLQAVRAKYGLAYLAGPEDVTEAVLDHMTKMYPASYIRDVERLRGALRDILATWGRIPRS